MSNTSELKLLLAVSRGDLNDITLLLRDGVNINCHTEDGEGLTPLHTSSCLGHVEISKFLIANGSNVNQQSSTTGSTPLHEAVKYNNFDIVALLLHSGARLSIRNHDGEIPEDLARLYGHNKILDFITDNKDYFEQQNSQSCSQNLEKTEGTDYSSDDDTFCDKLEDNLQCIKKEMKHYKVLLEKAQADANTAKGTYFLNEAGLQEELDKLTAELIKYKTLYEEATNAVEEVTEVKTHNVSDIDDATKELEQIEAEKETAEEELEHVQTELESLKSDFLKVCQEKDIQSHMFQSQTKEFVSDLLILKEVISDMIF